MTISLRPEHLRRYRDMGRLLVKYGRSDLVRDAGLDEALAGTDAPFASENGHGNARAGEVGGDARAVAEAKDLATDLEAMGPTYIKLGQLLSTRVDLLPAEYVNALSRLQDSVEPVPWDVIEETVNRELGVRLQSVYAEFERAPIASASLGQVHRAVLRSGRQVAVKVQRPGIRDQIVGDLDALEDITTFLDRRTEAGRRLGFTDMLHEFRKVLLRELDYRAEARNLETVARNLAGFGSIVVPKPVADYSTPLVLTMDLIEGRKITDVGPLGRLDIDGPALAEQLFSAYLKQILVDGFFHADPHPGNVLVTPDGRLGLIDLGMVASVPPALQECLVKLLLAIGDGRGTEAAEVLVAMGEPLAAFDDTQFVRAVSDLVAMHHEVAVDELQAGQVVAQLSRVALDAGLRPPAALTMLAKALLNLDRVGRALDPEFKPAEAIQRHAASVMRSRVLRSTSTGDVYGALLDTKEFVEKLPARANRLLESLANNEFRVHVEAIDEEELISGIQKVANRVTIGVVLAALIIGAAMLMRIPTEYEILGYPAIAMVFFLVAACGAIALMLTILVTDRRRKPKPTDPR